MSTYQPPGGQPPEGTPAYTQPQDPWASGQDHGLASVPTDPIPQQYDPYAHGVAGDQVWSQETVAHGGAPYGYAPQPPQRNKAGMIAVVFLAVLILGGGGGFAAWYLTTQRNQPTEPETSNTTSATTPATSPSTTAEPSTSFDPHNIKQNDCIVNKGTLTKPLVEFSACVPGSFKVIKKIEGAEIKENAQGKFDADTTSVAACGGTGFESWYGYKDPSDESKDVFFCLTDNK
jgi:hypothetical protein